MIGVLASAALALPFLGSPQSVAVTGNLTCDGEPAANAKVVLRDLEIFGNEVLAQGFSNLQGVFNLTGGKTEVTTIDPKLYIYHKCNHDGICYKKLSIVVPDDYVTKGPTPTKLFNVGHINLAGEFSDATDCTE
ncbi:hypothetical protein Y032_0007g3326 [Ancylostoma ceylanicum]|nr:hypothetical protein Y032_0007g3326 [Ancylostoma ceylanicum]